MEERSILEDVIKKLKGTSQRVRRAHFCLEILDEALGQGIPEILNTDQGSQFTRHDWISRVKGAGVFVSMNGKGRWVDNVIIERFWRTIKHEHVLLHSYEDLRQARRSIGDFINLYNHKRLHQSLRYQQRFIGWFCRRPVSF